ncbi:MAG: hypothetical protein L3J39_16675 [Verrucomicrobiales bacterium]|nr:hypothetical protein [Verrucomicrobiales bacterium]
MMIRVSFFTILSTALLLPSSAWSLDFETDIQPILKKKCFKCHSGPKAKKGLRWDKTKVIEEWIKEGTDSVIIPGSPVKSLFFIKASQGQKNHPDGMPPLRRGTPMSEGELRLVSKWITEGAKLTPTDEAAPVAKMQDKQESKVLAWTNLGGQTIKAVFVSLKADAVVLKLENGKQMTYPMNKLKPESRKQAEKMAAEKK